VFRDVIYQPDDNPSSLWRRRDKLVSCMIALRPYITEYIRAIFRLFSQLLFSCVTW